MERGKDADVIYTNADVAYHVTSSTACEGREKRGEERRGGDEDGAVAVWERADCGGQRGVGARGWRGERVPSSAQYTIHRDC